METLLYRYLVGVWTKPREADITDRKKEGADRKSRPTWFLFNSVGVNCLGSKLLPHPRSRSTASSISRILVEATLWGDVSKAVFYYRDPSQRASWEPAVLDAVAAIHLIPRLQATSRGLF